jgi:plastocyanin
MQLFFTLPITFLASLAIAQSDSIDASQPSAVVSASNAGDFSAATATNLGDQSAATATNLGDLSAATATNLADQSAATATNLGDQSVASSIVAVAPAASSEAPFANATNGQQVWVVKVGSPDGKFVFSPSEIRANAGDLVQFQFYALVGKCRKSENLKLIEYQNHSVASSWYDSPCVPNSQQQGSINAASNAFFTGFMPTAADGSLTYTIPVIDDQPVWFYCTQGKHCQAGMVGVINE